jgi:hypothetical protein
MTMRIDGVAQPNVNQYSGSVLYRQAFTKTGLTNITHSVVLDYYSGDTSGKLERRLHRVEWAALRRRPSVSLALSIRVECFTVADHCLTPAITPTEIIEGVTPWTIWTSTGAFCPHRGTV